MKTLLLTLTLLATGIVFWFCKSPKFKADQLPDKQLRWGSGGGFTGRETTYILLENGQVFKRNAGADTAEELPGARKGQAKDLFASAGTLGLATLDFKYPGNTYSFIDLQDGDVVNRVSWGDNAHPVDPKIKAFFGQLAALATEK